METSKMPKPFWERPEGQTGKVVLGGILLGGAFILYKFLPAIILLLQNTLHAMLLLGAVGAITFLALDPKVRTLVAYGYKMIMRAITGAFIQLDPIAIIEGYVEDLGKNLGKMDQQIGNLKGQMRSLKNVIDSNSKEMENNLKLASAAKEKGKQNITVLQSRKAGRLKDSNLTLSALYMKMEKLYRVLCKMYETAGVLLEDIKDEVEVKKRERTAVLAGHSAFKSAMKIISGDTDKQALFNQTMEYMAEDLGAKVGEMERFMELSSGFMESVDLQNGIYQEEGFNLLEQWEKEGTSVLLGNDKQLLLSQAEDESNIIDIDNHYVAQQPVRQNRYNELLK
jgi:hypothetical protein